MADVLDDKCARVPVASHGTTEIENKSVKRGISFERSCTQKRRALLGEDVTNKAKLNFLKTSTWSKLICKTFARFSHFAINNNKKKGNFLFENEQRSSSISSNDVATGVLCNLSVSQTKPSYAKGDRVPGLVGLRNLGNTCFINAVIQCLTHTDLLAEYFVLDRYKDDLRRNKFNSKKYGTKGEITEQLAAILKSIWLCQYDPEISNEFKSTVDKFSIHYRGNRQHDAQEFLLWILDKVHEDLNVATKKKYKTIKNSFGSPEAVAAETLANHIRCNNSFIHGVFQAQFFSSVKCTRCEKQSNTFDPFVCVSIPVPHNQVPVYVTALYSSQQPRQVRLGLTVPSNSEISFLRKILCDYTGIPDHCMLIVDISKNGFQRTFTDGVSASSVEQSENLYCLEVTDAEAGCLMLTWVNLLAVDDCRVKFGSPFVMSVNRETSYVDLQKLLLKEMSWMLLDEVATTEQEIPLFRIRVVDTAEPPELSYLDPTVDHPLFTHPIDQALAMCSINQWQPIHIKLSLEWDLQAKESTIADDSEQVEEHSSVKNLRSTCDPGMTASLEECFKLYTQAEVLGAEDAWHCTSCNLKQQVVKQLALWSLPLILVVHLKRFKQTTSSSKQTRSSVKLTTTVDFPVYGFDMTPHLAQGFKTSTPLATIWSSWCDKTAQNKTLPFKRSIRRENTVYDLYAVCNHHGHDLQSGHYTAYCRNPYDGQWYNFDDDVVTPMAEKDVVTPSAYILFYQLRAISPSDSDHWSSKLTPTAKLTRSSEEIACSGSSDKNGFNVRGNGAYSTLQPVVKQCEKLVPEIRAASRWPSVNIPCDQSSV